MPAGWEWRRLGDVANTASGGTPNRSTSQYWNGTIPWLKSGELKDGYITEASEFITEEGLKNSNAKLFKSGTLLLALYGATAGRLGILEFDTTSNQAVCAITPRKNSFDSKYLFYFLRSKREQIVKDSFGGAQPNISQGYIREMLVPLPPLAEQQRIVAKLDALFERIDEAIALTEAALKSVQNLLPAALDEVFGQVEEKGWHSTSVEKVLEKITTGTTPPTKNDSYYDDGDVEWYSPSDFGRKMVLNNSKKKITELAVEDGKAKLYPADSLLLVAIGATIGKVGVIKKQAASNQQITALTFKKNILGDYSYYWFLFIKQHLISKASAATLPIINQAGIKQLPFCYPEFKVQEQIVNYLGTISAKGDKIKFIFAQHAQSLQILKKCLISKNFQYTF